MSVCVDTRTRTLCNIEHNETWQDSTQPKNQNLTNMICVKTKTPNMVRTLP